MIKINKDKCIGNVIFVVEGKKTEFEIIKNIFTDLLNYDIYESNDDKSITKFKHHTMRANKILVVTHEFPQIKHLNKNIEKVINKLIEYEINYEDMAMYFIYDRDRDSNTSTQIEDAIRKYKNSRCNDFDTNGMLLLSYPCIEAIYFNNANNDKRFVCGNEIKEGVKKLAKEILRTEKVGIIHFILI